MKDVEVISYMLYSIFMYMNIIHSELKGSSPEVKWFLLMLLHEFMPSKQVALTVPELSACLGVSKDVVTKSCKYLVSIGALEQRPLKTDKNGFLKAYDILVTEESIDRLFPANQKNKIPVGSSDHMHLVELLTTNKSNEFSIPKLKLANRLLLSVLLSYADACGVVRGIGSAVLMKLTCMSKDRLQSQLEKLKAEGYIRASVSGVTGRYIFGVAKGLYWMNLKHEHYKQHASPGDTVSILKEDVFGGTFNREASDIYTLAGKVISLLKTKKGNWIDTLIRKEGYLQPHLNNINVIAYFFQDNQMSRVRNYLQLKINEYACFIMSNHQNDINDPDDQLKNDISMDLFPDSFALKEVTSHFTTEELKALVVDFIYEISLVVARKLNEQLKLIPELNLVCSSYTLVSMFDRNVNYFTLEMFCKMKTQKKSYLYRIKPKHLPERKYSNEIESNMSGEEKFEYGLLTRPSKRENRWPIREVNNDSVPE
jgi:hypothetical protein